jgi:hypothetical protein
MTPITINTAGLCPADIDYIKHVVAEIEAYARRELGRLDIEVEDFAKREFRLPSLRGHLPKEERPYIRIELVPLGWAPELSSVRGGQLSTSRLRDDLRIVWTELSGEQEYFVAYEDHDKYGMFDNKCGTLKEDDLLTLTDEQASELGLRHNDVTLAELLGIRYLARFTATDE